MVPAGQAPRQPLAEVKARLAAAGCPDAAFAAAELFRLAAGRDARLSDRPLSEGEAARFSQQNWIGFFNERLRPQLIEAGAKKS